jgi:hypothetical protein
MLETYVKRLEELEGIANSFSGVDRFSPSRRDGEIRNSRGERQDPTTTR